MAKIRVHELANELGVTSKAVVEKCKAEGLPVKTASSGLSAGQEETIRDWFSEESSEGVHTAVELTKHVDLDKAHEDAAKQRKRSKKQEAEDAAALAAAEAAAAEEAAAVEAAAAAAAEVEAAEEAVAAEAHAAAQAAAVAEAVAATEAAAAAEEAAEDEESADKPVDKSRAPSKPAPIMPAGPQVVPKPAQLKGPKVIRVEQPDYVPRPQARQSYSDGPIPLGANRPGVTGERQFTSGPSGPGGPGGPGKKGVSRRSPRRKAGRSAKAEAGEKLREWGSTDLAERADRIKEAKTSLRRRSHVVSRGGAMVSIGAKSGQVEIEEPITIKNLSAVTGLKTAVIIKKIMTLGMMVTINQVIETELAETICDEFEIELVVAQAKTAEELLMEQLDQREKGEQTHRAPVVTFLGHVDHGKTSLLDYIRKTTVADGEAGGITQAIGSYRHDMGEQHIVFLDTPGHEAFTAMRARGANMTDVVVLVVAADDGVMPQTVEAISHAKASGVPIVVALNKCDVPNANINRALGQLAEHDLQPREWGGDTEVLQTSATVGTGMDELLELLSLESEMLELVAEKKAPASGYVIESRMDPGKGVVATLLNINGTLKTGDVLLAGRGYGKIRQIYSDKGKRLGQAGPAMPVTLTGLDEVPQAGDRFFVVSTLDEARTVAEQRREEDRSKVLAQGAKAPKTLEEMMGKIAEGEQITLPVIIKADVQGSIEALRKVLGNIGSEETKLNILHAGVGGVSSGDVTLAEASGAIIIGFNVVADPKAKKLAEASNIQIRTYRVIYDIAEDMKLMLEKGLAPELREEVIGQAVIRQTFKVSRVGTIAGCYVTEGMAQRNAKVRIIRNNVVQEDGRTLESLKRIKDDAREVKAGLECGIKLAGYDDLKEDDVLEFYKTIEVARTL